MVSRVIALKALSKLTGIDNLNVFHKVGMSSSPFPFSSSMGVRPRVPSLGSTHQQWFAFLFPFRPSHLTFPNPQADKVLGGTTVKLKDGIEPEVDSVTGEVKYLDGVLECYMLKEVIQAQNAEEEKAKLAETVFDSEVKLGE
eukprot:874447-Amorphochlora_amoeboformis.AAC.1